MSFLEQGRCRHWIARFRMAMGVEVIGKERGVFG